jgi:hypothetical protein
LRTENNELRDEIAHYDSELRELREQQFIKQSQNENYASSNNQNQTSMINSQKSGLSSGIGQGSGIGSGVLNRQNSNNNVRKMEEIAVNSRASIEDFQNAEREIADKMKCDEAKESEGSPEAEDPNNEQQDSEDEEDYEMKFPSKYHN